jgi:hypothetical protein
MARHPLFIVLVLGVSFATDGAQIRKWISRVSPHPRPFSQREKGELQNRSLKTFRKYVLNAIVRSESNC